MTGRGRTCSQALSDKPVAHAAATRSSASKRWRLALVAGKRDIDPAWTATRPVLDWIDTTLAAGHRPLRRCWRWQALLAGPRWPLRSPRTFRRADARTARRAADRPQLLRGRRARGADAVGLAHRPAFRRAARREPTGRKPANGRARSHCRPGARRTCAPAATMSRRRWR